MSEQTLDPLVNLGCAGITEAVRDAKDGCEATQYWLKTGAWMWLDYIGLEQDFVIKWVNEGCNLPENKQVRGAFRKGFQTSSTQYKRRVKA